MSPRVLIADDSALMCRVIKEILTEGGYDVVSESPNGLKAVEHYKSYKPDLVLMDYNMPQMNGMDSARHILKHDPTACIVMVTSLGGKKKILDALRIGVKNYIVKPFEAHSFLSVLRKVMGNKAPRPKLGEEETEGDCQAIGSFFGQYLLQKGTISKEQLIHLLDVQSTVNRKIGHIAVDEGLLLPEHITKILKVQKRINKYFGQLAIQMGLLSQTQVTYLVEKQREHYMDIDEILLRENMLPKNVIQKELETFKMLDEEDQGVFNVKWVSKHFQNGFIFETFVEQTLKLLMRLTGIFVMEGECGFDRKDMTSHGIVIKIAISGDSHWAYFLNLSNNIGEQIAHGMLEADEGEMRLNNMNFDAANELVNIACGNAISKLDGKGVRFEVSTPKIISSKKGEVYAFSPDDQILNVPILVPEGEVDLVISGTDIFRPVEG